MAWSAYSCVLGGGWTEVAGLGKGGAQSEIAGVEPGGGGFFRIQHVSGAYIEIWSPRGVNPRFVATSSGTGGAANPFSSFCASFTLALGGTT